VFSAGFCFQAMVLLAPRQDAVLRTLPAECRAAVYAFSEAAEVYALRETHPTLAVEARFPALHRACRQLLLRTKFPMHAASFVFGLNGQYFSRDTWAGARFHEAVPPQLLRTLTTMIREQLPGVCFTSILIKAFDSTKAVKQNRTLAFSNGDIEETYVMALGDCGGGGVDMGQIKGLKRRDCHERFVRLPKWTHQRWQWPTKGVYHMIQVWCEHPESLQAMTREERELLAATGFLLPKELESVPERVYASTISETEEATEDEVTTGDETEDRTVLEQAASILEVELDGLTARQVMSAYRARARENHPDRQHPDDHEAQRRFTRLNWARNQLLQALVTVLEDQQAQDHEEQLALEE